MIKLKDSILVQLYITIVMIKLKDSILVQLYITIVMIKLKDSILNISDYVSYIC
jgi:hypothetical protein